MSVRKRWRNWYPGFEHLEDRQLLSILGLLTHSISATAGVPFSGSVATLVDSDLSAKPTDFTVTIDWGAGQNPTTGQVVAGPTSGLFLVTGTYTYPLAGSFPLLVSAKDTAGDSASDFGTASVAPGMTILPTTVPGTPGQPLSNVTVASFIDPVSTDASDFTALIQWGNGISSIGSIGTVNGVPHAFTVTGPTTGSITYALPGTYTTTVTVVGSGGAPSGIATGTAVISALPTIVGQPVVTQAMQSLSDVVVATFTDPYASDVGANFTAQISWGDGPLPPDSPPAKVTGQNGVFSILGSHTYTAPGTYPIAITLVTPEGSTISGTSTATVQNPNVNVPVPFAGQLTVVAGNGPNAANGFTTTNRPLFSGTAPAFTTVQLFARPANVDVNNSLGYAIASASGKWTLATGPLADGFYTVTAVVTGPGGFPSQPQPIMNNGTVVIDTQAPKVVAVHYGGGDQITVLFSDATSGMNLANLKNPANYILTGPYRRVLQPTPPISPSSSLSPGAGEKVVLTFPSIRRTRSSLWVFTMNMGITDNAGNPLPAFSQGIVMPAARQASVHRGKVRA
ncbi:MAG: Ig-like domain-containing protein [Isosphaeraceae bacterium]